MPHPPVSRPRGEKPLGGGGAFKTKKCCVKPRGRGREEGGGGAAQAACFPSNPAERTSPTLGRGCGARGKGGGLSSATVFHFTFCRPRWGRGAAAPRNCSAPSPESRVRSSPVTGQEAEPSRPSAWTRRALGCCPQPLDARPEPTALPRPRTLSTLRAKKLAGPGSAGSPNRPLPRPAADPGVGPLQLERSHRLRIAQTLDRETVVAHGCPVADSGRGRSGVCGGAGTWSLWRSGRAPRSLQHWRRPTGGSSRSRATRRVSEHRWEMVPGRQRRRRNESPSEPGTLRTLFFALCRAWLDLSQAAGLMTTLDTLTSCSTFCFYCKQC